MNPATIETAWATALADAVAPLKSLPSLGGDVIPSDEAVFVVECEECDHKAGPYWIASLRFVVDSPALVAGMREQHVAIFDAVCLMLLPAEEGAEPEIVSLFPAADLALNGIFVRTSRTERGDLHWRGVIEVIAGHSRAV